MFIYAKRSYSQNEFSEVHLGKLGTLAAFPYKCEVSVVDSGYRPPPNSTLNNKVM